MKAKKILLKCAGIVQFIASAFAIVLGGLIVLASKLVKDLLDVAYNDIQEQVKEFGADAVIASGEATEEILAMTKEEFFSYMTKWCNILAVFIFITAIIGIVYGVFCIIYSKKYETTLLGRKKKKIVLGILAPFAMGISISTILVIIALCLKDKQPVEVIPPENQ